MVVETVNSSEFTPARAEMLRSTASAVHGGNRYRISPASLLFIGKRKGCFGLKVAGRWGQRGAGAAEKALRSIPSAI
jgi:hypothetical protein